MQYKLRVGGITTGSTANEFITVLGMKLPNTVGYRARLRKLTIGGAGAAAQDVQTSFRLRRTNNTSDGTSTAVNVNTIGKADPNSRDSFVSAIGKNYSAEPTTFENGTLGVAPINSRNTLVMEWDPETAPKWGPNHTLCLEAAPGAASAVSLDVVAEWEEF
jgi:hypothetical protein